MSGGSEPGRNGAEGCYWAASADPAPPLSALAGERQTEIAIIGGGFTGLSAARHLASAGVASIVLEAGALGSGASGRNGGFVSTKFRVSFAEMAHRHGRDVARRMYAIGREAADCVEETVAELGLSRCAFGHYGAITAAVNQAGLSRLEAGVNWLRREFGDTSVSLLSAEEVARETGSRRFLGGQLARDVGGIHPLNLVHGLARDLLRRGAPVHEHSPASAIRRDGGGLVIETPDGLVRAKQAVIATNAYSRITPATATLSRRIVPFQSAIIATAPIPADLRRRILPTGRLVSDSKRVLRWFRVVDDRLLFGGRGASGSDQSQRAYSALRANMVEIFPELADVEIAYRWSGFVGMTADRLPHVGRLDDRLLFAMGYNGTGVAMANLLGRFAARLAMQEELDLALLSGDRFYPLPLYRLHVPASRAVAGWYQLLDALGR